MNGTTAIRVARGAEAPRAAGAGEWDAFVRGTEGWTHFHLHGWRTVLERAHGLECQYLTERDEHGALAAVLPLVRLRSALFGHYLVSMPFLNYGGPLGEPHAVARVTARALELARTQGADVLELRARTALPVELPCSHRKVTMLLDLPSSGEALMKVLDSKVRSQVRRPAKAGVTYRFGPEQLEPFERVYARHMRDLGTPAQPLRFFRAIRDVFGDEVWFGCAYLNDEPIAAGCGFRWADEFEISWASALVEHKQTSANMGLYFAFMERCIEQGVNVFNFGRCTPGSGTHRFKAQWGAREQQLYWYSHGKGGEEAATAAHSDRWSWGPRLWRRLPLPLAAAIGPRLIRSIP